MKVVLSRKNAVKILCFALTITLVLGIAFFVVNETVLAKNKSIFGSSEAPVTVQREFTPFAEAPEGFLLAYEDNGAWLFVHPQTAEIAVQSKAFGTVWYSNPQDRAADPLALGDEARRLGSQLRVEYYTADNSLKQMDNFNQSIREGQYEIAALEKGVMITFSIGEIKIVREHLPQAVEKSRFESLVLSRLEETEKSNLLKRYKLITNEKATEKEKEQFPGVEDKDIYILNPFAPDYELPELRRLIFDTAGYTVDDLLKDNRENGITAEAPVPEEIVIPVQYTLDEGALAVRVSMDTVKYPEGIELYKIHLLEYMGAAGTEREGYMLVPDGSGALVNLNNRKNTAEALSLRLYGREYAVSAADKPAELQQAVMPVFGMKTEDGTLFAILEEGDAHAFVCADVAGRSHSYNKVYPAFEVTPYDVMTIKNRLGVIQTNAFQEESYGGNLTVRYNILPPEKSDYTDMAVFYKDYLTQNNKLSVKNDSPVPFVAEFLAASNDVVSVFGVPVTVSKALTTFENAKEISGTLLEGGVGNLSVKFTGWFGGGEMNHDPAKASPTGKIGGAKGLTSFQSFADEKGIRLYMDAAAQNVYRGFPFFNTNARAVRVTYNQVAKQYQYSAATLYRSEKLPSYTVLSPLYIGESLNGFQSRLGKYGVDGLWLRDVGDMLYSDFHSKAAVDRQASQSLITEALAGLHEKGARIGLQTANAYTWEYADALTSMPMDSSGYAMEDRQIPFLQIVLSGRMEYTGSAANLDGKTHINMLRAVESGAGLYYKWVYADNLTIKNINYKYAGKLYSLSYSDWIDEAMRFYERYQRELGEIRNSGIVGHEQLADGVFRTDWEKGSVIVNYNEYEYADGNIQVAGLDWKRIV